MHIVDGSYIKNILHFFCPSIVPIMNKISNEVLGKTHGNMPQMSYDIRSIFDLTI